MTRPLAPASCATITVKLKLRLTIAVLEGLVQMMGGLLNVEVLILPRSAFCGDQAASMNLLKVAIGELVACFAVLAVLFVNAKMPPRVLIITMKENELVLLLPRRLMLAPRVSLIKNILALFDECLRLFECCVVEFHRHDFRSRCALSIRPGYPKVD